MDVLLIANKLHIFITFTFFVDIDECASSPCQNGGNCTDIVNGHTCDCVAGYDGINCENGNNERLFEMFYQYQNLYLGVLTYHFKFVIDINI